MSDAAKICEDLAERIRTNPLGWLLGIGNVVNVTFDPDEARIVINALMEWSLKLSSKGQ
jgi:hypothetical protein